MPTVSPLLSRLKSKESLTLDNLARHIPRVKKGIEASEILKNSTDLTPAERHAIRNDINIGERSKEDLVLMALPLVRTIAHKEYGRRQSWNSRVSFDDMIQEGIGGFLRGILSYNVSGTQSSATNYLGQWILSDIRRHVESLEHDFSIPHETIERHRKIRAIRSYLFNSLGRNPSDTEILEHANSGAYQANNGNKMGKLVKDPSTFKKLTQKNLDEERAYFASTGALESIVASDGEDDYYERNSSSIFDATPPSTTEEVENASAKESLTAFFSQVFKSMSLGSMQEDIIRQKFGLAPYGEEAPLADIAIKTKLTKYKINQVLTTFSQEMSSPGSAFHYVVSRTSEDELDAMGMAWIAPMVGEWKFGRNPHPTPPILTSNMRPMTVKAKTHFGAPQRRIEGRFIAVFHCPADNKDFNNSYLLSRSIPQATICPDCGTESPKISHAARV